MSDSHILFSPMEIDAIGEIMNISMGSAATAASTLLENQVMITTPTVEIVHFSEFNIAGFGPAIAVNIQYVEGISGSNILLLRREDVRLILQTMMMSELPDDYQIDEMAESAICELMNQMMGSSATVLSCFLGRTINISTPGIVQIDSIEEFKQKYYSSSEYIVTVEFSLIVKDMLESRFVSSMEIGLAREIISASFDFNTEDEQTEDPVEGSVTKPDPLPAPLPPPPVSAPPIPGSVQTRPASGVSVPLPVPQSAYPSPAPQFQYPQAPYPQQPYYMPSQQYPPYAIPPYSPPTAMNYSHAAPTSPEAGSGQTDIDLVAEIPVSVTVELGRTRRKIKDILAFGTGAIVELDKAAAAPVDIFVNGELAARGDLVVIDDNFSVRVTEILKTLNIG